MPSNVRIVDFGENPRTVHKRDRLSITKLVQFWLKAKKPAEIEKSLLASHLLSARQKEPRAEVAV